MSAVQSAEVGDGATAIQEGVPGVAIARRIELTLIWPASLMSVALSRVPPAGIRSLRSVMGPPLDRKAWEGLPGVAHSCPAALMVAAALRLPPRVPRSVMGLPLYRKAWGVFPGVAPAPPPVRRR